MDLGLSYFFKKMIADMKVRDGILYIMSAIIIWETW